MPIYWAKTLTEIGKNIGTGSRATLYLKFDRYFVSQYHFIYLPGYTQLDY
jgi:hypothetical protein